MPPAARPNDPTAHGNPLSPGPGCPTVLIGFMPAWRALPASMAAAIDALSNAMNSFMTKPQMTPADAAADLAQISQKLTEGGAQAASAGAPAAAAAAGTSVGTLNTANTALTTTWTTASAAPGGQPAANVAYTEGIKAAAAAAASAVMSAMASLSDMHICPIPCPVPPHGPGFVTKGSDTVIIGKLSAARQGDKVMEACGGSDPIATGYPSVVIGDSGSGGGGGGGGGSPSGGGSSGGGGSTDDFDDTPPEAAPAAAPPPPAARTPGPSSQKVDQGTHFIEIELVDEANQPVVGESVVIQLPQGEQTKEVRSGLDRRGTFRVEGLKHSGSCTIRFPDLDLAAWRRWTPTSPPSSSAATSGPPPNPDAEPVEQGSAGSARGTWRTARQGECISSIAAAAGHFWDTLWNHPANAELKRRRGNPNALLPEDAVFVPEKRPREESGSTDQHHKFLRRGEPSWLDLQLLDQGQARANEEYTLDVDGQSTAGKTDPSGRIHVAIPGTARRAVLKIGDDEYRLTLGGLDPVNTISGVQQRLRNLNYGCGPVDGQLGPRTLAALNLFRQHMGLPVSNELDSATIAKLGALHDQMQSSPRPTGGADKVEFVDQEPWVEPTTGGEDADT